jgi:hypothetical protein
VISLDSFSYHFSHSEKYWGRCEKIMDCPRDGYETVLSEIPPNITTLPLY